jgi:hypothetical protein
MARQIHQSQVPDGMVGNVPWGVPLDEWTDRMVERGLKNLYEDAEAGVPYPVLTAAMEDQAAVRGLDIL